MILRSIWRELKALFAKKSRCAVALCQRGKQIINKRTITSRRSHLLPVFLLTHKTRILSFQWSLLTLSVCLILTLTYLLATSLPPSPHFQVVSKPGVTWPTALSHGLLSTLFSTRCMADLSCPYGWWVMTTTQLYLFPWMYFKVST